MRLLLVLTAPLLAQDALPPLVVVAERETSSALASWSSDEIADFAPRTIDELLATDPAFSLYRPQTATFANPTAAGVSLRHTGATAASRSLVLLDGIPQNDPFGGWIHWARYDPSTLDSARIVPAAGSAVWGNLSPAGSVRLTRRPIAADRTGLIVTAGSHGTYGGSLTGDVVADDGSFGVSLHTFGRHTDGFHALPAWQRGPIDTRLSLDLAGTDLRFIWRPVDRLTVEPSLSFYDERRSNGTPLTGNTTEAFDASLRITLEEGPTTLQALAYYQRRRFASVFSAVDATRTRERMALNQFDVPGEGIGGALTLDTEIGDELGLTLGADLRRLEGETQEDAGTFRRRRAGGTRSLAGFFGTARWTPHPGTRLDASLRLDHWELRDGKRIERSLGTGGLLRADFFRNRSDWEPSAAISLTRKLTTSLDSRFALSTAYRLPTLNELHRPFRVRNDLTEANPALDSERFYSLEAGLTWQAASCLTLDATVFHHWIHDAIANVPVTDPAEITAIFGTLPPGGTGAQRRNVDEARVLGLQGSIDWRPSDRWGLRFDGLWSHTEFVSSNAQPLLEGRPFPQTPDLRLLGTADFRLTEGLHFFIGAEFASSRYDDALATRRLSSYDTYRIGATWRASDSFTLHARVENLLDAEIPTGLAGNGLLSTGQPRAFWLTAEWRL